MIHTDSVHAESQAEVDAIKAAVATLNASETVGNYEENANHHSAAEFREEMAADIHVPKVTAEWVLDRRGGYEHSTCDICGREVSRDA